MVCMAPGKAELSSLGTTSDKKSEFRVNLSAAESRDRLKTIRPVVGWAPGRGSAAADERSGSGPVMGAVQPAGEDHRTESGRRPSELGNAFLILSGVTLPL
jgi:hypothetical protein